MKKPNYHVWSCGHFEDFQSDFRECRVEVRSEIMPCRLCFAACVGYEREITTKYEHSERYTLCSASSGDVEQPRN